MVETHLSHTPLYILPYPSPNPIFSPHSFLPFSFPRKSQSQSKMAVIQLIVRVDTICKKYQKYDFEKHSDQNAYGDDAFSRLYAVFETEIDKAIRKSELAAVEKNRATLVAMNAEIRRTKAKLLEEVPKLKKLSRKRVKGVSKEDLAIRSDLALAIPERIEEIPDGTPSKKGARSSSSANIKFDATDANMGNSYFNKSEESDKFRQEYEMRKTKQDEGIDFISDGLDTLKNLAMDMNEEMDRQVPLMDEIDTKVDKANSDLRNTNARLKDTIQKMRSSRNMMIDLILLCILLGIASYLYNVISHNQK